MLRLISFFRNCDGTTSSKCAERRAHAVSLIAACALWFLAASLSAATIDVTVGPGLSFSPSSITVAPGDTVRWVWAPASINHTTTSDLSVGSEVWDSGVMSAGTFSHTFNTVGDWSYYCALHSFPGGSSMNGVVHVVAPAPLITSFNPASGAPGFVIDIDGSGFQPGAAVTFGGAASPTVTFLDPTHVQATVPNVPAGTVSITLTNPDQQSAIAPQQFTIVAASAIPIFSGLALVALMASAAVVAWRLLR